MYEKLTLWGCNTDEALERFVGDRELYVTCLHLFVSDVFFVSLGEALQSKNYKLAFEAVHTLKGVAGNVSANPLFILIDSMATKIRNTEYAELDEDYQNVMRLRSELEAILN